MKYGVLDREKNLKMINKIKDRFSNIIIDTHNFRGDNTIIIKKDSIFEFAKFLKEDDEEKFDFLIDLTAVDYLGKKEIRFEVVYHFYSSKFNERIRIKLPVSEKDLIVPSLTKLYAIADWFEREVYDMYGIIFSGHPDLRRILLYEEFEGYPLRKDYPIDKRQPKVSR